MSEKIQQLAAGIERESAKENRFPLDAVLEGFLDVVGITDMDGKISRINRAVEVLGYKKEELIGKLVTEILAKRSLRWSG